MSGSASRGGQASDRAEHRSTGNDLGSVRAVGAPSTVGWSLDAEAVVHLRMVPLAQECGVVEVGLAAVDPVDQVVDVASVAGSVAAGEYALVVAQLDRLA